MRMLLFVLLPAAAAAAASFVTLRKPIRATSCGNCAGGEGEAPPTGTIIAEELIHSEEELRHALSHLLPRDLEGYETMTLYRNVRRKYLDEATMFSNNKTLGMPKEGPRQVHSFRYVNQGVLAAYQAACSPQHERNASALYVTINPRHVPNALKATHQLYFQWLEYQAGASLQQVRKGHLPSFAGTLDVAFAMQLSKQQSRTRLRCIDVDDPNPDTWLHDIRQALKHAVEMVIETRAGFHVLYKAEAMNPQAHRALAEVLQRDPATGQDARVTKLSGSAVSCPVPGAYQARHATRILQCNCPNCPNLLPPL